MGVAHHTDCCRNRHSERYNADFIHACAACPGSDCRGAFHFTGLASVKLAAKITADRARFGGFRVNLAGDRAGIIGRLNGNAFSAKSPGSQCPASAPLVYGLDDFFRNGRRFTARVDRGRGLHWAATEGLADADI